MDQSLGVRGREPARDLHRGVDRAPHRHRSAREPVAQGFAVEQFHDGERRAVFGPGVMKRQDVGMRQRGDGLRFAIESREPLRIARDRLGQNLDGDVAIEARIARAIHLAHPTSAKRIEDFVAAEPAAGGQGHGALSLSRGSAPLEPARARELLGRLALRQPVHRDDQTNHAQEHHPEDDDDPDGARG